MIDLDEIERRNERRFALLATVVVATCSEMSEPDILKYVDEMMKAAKGYGNLL